MFQGLKMKRGKKITFHLLIAKERREITGGGGGRGREETRAIFIGFKSSCLLF